MIVIIVKRVRYALAYLPRATKLDIPVSMKRCNYGLRARKSSSRLIKFLVNNIHIYDSKSIYYENIFRN